MCLCWGTSEEDGNPLKQQRREGQGEGHMGITLLTRTFIFVLNPLGEENKSQLLGPLSLKTELLVCLRGVQSLREILVDHTFSVLVM